MEVRRPRDRPTTGAATPRRSPCAPAWHSPRGAGPVRQVVLAKWIEEYNQLKAKSALIFAQVEFPMDATQIRKDLFE